MSSRESVLKNEKFQQIFGEYAEVIGITKAQNVPAWEPIIKRNAEIAERKRIADEEAVRIANEEAIRMAAEEKIRQEE